MPMMYFSKIAGVNFEDLVIDLYYWFGKSTKRKGVLAEYMEFCKALVNKVAFFGEMHSAYTTEIIVD